MFADELRIIKEDELRGLFEKFSPNFILNLLDMRANEVRLEKINSNPSSRITTANITRIMKLSSRLKQLFEINGGNTEVLDAVLGSQSQLEKLELKLTTKRNALKTSITESLSPRNSHKPQYLQIPDDVKIHEFTDHLKDIQLSEIKAPFASISASEVIEAVKRRIEQFEELPNVLSDKVFSYHILLSRLKRLFEINGSYTFILDTVINSQEVFDQLELKLKSKRPKQANEVSEYKQVPEDFHLEDFNAELELVRGKLDSDFASATSDDVLQVTKNLIESEVSGARKLCLQRLLRNLKALFKHNNNETFILDKILSSALIFDAFEEKIKEKRYAELADNGTKKIRYQENDQLFPLLENQNSDDDEGFLEQDLKIKTAVLEAMSKEEKKLSESDPEEYERLKNLTPEGIRESYAKLLETPVRSIRKDTVENFLKDSKKNKDSLEEMKWREREAYEWSSNIYLRHRTLESKNFFNPISLERTSYPFPMFPSREIDLEYLILFTNGQQLAASRNPLGTSHVQENLLTIFEKIPDTDLPKVLESIRRLRKQHWSLLGSAKNGSMLVLSRNKRRRMTLFLNFLKSALFATGVVLVLSIMDARRSVRAGHDAQINAISHASGETRSGNETQQGPELFWKRLLWAS